MNSLIESLRKYFIEVMGVSIKDPEKIIMDVLPIYLIDTYEFYQFQLEEHSLIALIRRNKDEFNPSMIGSHINLINRYTTSEVFYLTSSLTSYDRKRLILHKIPFVVPGNQMYLPNLAIDLRERFIRSREVKQLLSPATQAFIIFYLTHASTTSITPTTISKQLNYSKMTMSRSFHEIVDNGLGKITKQGREKFISFNSDKKEFWEKAKVFLSSPIEKEFWITKNITSDIFVKSGLTALSEYSMLSLPDIPTYATCAKNWNNNLDFDQIDELLYPEKNTVKIEIWAYDPLVSTKRGIVDPFSLFLSLQNSFDERIQSALQAMIKGVIW